MAQAGATLSETGQSRLNALPVPIRRSTFRVSALALVSPMAGIEYHQRRPEMIQRYRSSSVKAPASFSRSAIVGSIQPAMKSLGWGV